MSYTTRRLALNEQCLVLQPILVKDVGRSAALVLQQMHYWISGDTYGKVIAGERWIYNSHDDWAKQIKIYSLSTIRRAITKLETLGFIKSNFLSPKKSDRTKSYTINYDKLNTHTLKTEGEGSADRKTIPDSEILPPTKMNRPCVQNEQILIETKITSKSKNSSEANASSDIVLKLLGIWEKRVGEGVGQGSLRLNPKRSRFLMAAFQTKFNRCFEQWTRYCDAIASSDFLMGRIKASFKASLDWVLKFDIVDRLFEGDFGITKKFTAMPQRAGDSQAGEGGTFSVCLETTLCDEMDHINTSDEPDAVKNVRKSLLKRVGQGAYVSWFRNAKIVEDTVNISLKCPNPFYKDYVTTHFSNPIQALSIVVVMGSPCTGSSPSSYP